MSPYAVRLEAGGAAVTVMSPDRAVVAWTARYAGPWWNADEVPAGAACSGPLVTASVDPRGYEDLAHAVTSGRYSSAVYAGHALDVTVDVGDGVVRAVCPARGYGYRSDPRAGVLEVVGCQVEDVAAATARVARETVRGVLQGAGWSVLHASAVERGGRVVLVLGGKGAGKTTSALLLARHGAGLVANDRVFVRVAEDGGVDVLPWPAAAAVGLGLLDALGWLDGVRERLEAGEQLHPTQRPAVTEALCAGRRTPLWDGGRELKAQFWPDQFVQWCGLTLSRGGRAGGLVFPRVQAGAAPALEERGRALEDGDFMAGATEDRYPDLLGLVRVDAGAAAVARREVVRRLSALPRQEVVLGHGLAANTELLAKVTGWT